MAKTPVRKTKKVETKKRRSVLAGHEQEFAQRVLAPKLFQILSAHDFKISMTELVKKYNKEFNASISASTLKRYLDVLNWKYERVPMWTGIPAVAVGDGTTPMPPDVGAHVRDTLNAPDDPEAAPAGASPHGAVGLGVPGGGPPQDEFEKQVVG